MEVKRKFKTAYTAFVGKLIYVFSVHMRPLMRFFCGPALHRIAGNMHLVPCRCQGFDFVFNPDIRREFMIENH